MWSRSAFFRPLAQMVYVIAEIRRNGAGKAQKLVWFLLILAYLATGLLIVVCVIRRAGWPNLGSAGFFFMSTGIIVVLWLPMSIVALYDELTGIDRGPKA